MTIATAEMSAGERMQMLDLVDDTIREREMEKSRGQAEKPGYQGTHHRMTAVVGARAQLGAGANLENACPYFAGCGLPIKSKPLCIGKDNYRGQACYGGRIFDEAQRGTITID